MIFFNFNLIYSQFLAILAPTRTLRSCPSPFSSCAGIILWLRESSVCIRIGVMRTFTSGPDTQWLPVCRMS